MWVKAFISVWVFHEDWVRMPVETAGLIKSELTHCLWQWMDLLGSAWNEQSNPFRGWHSPEREEQPSWVTVDCKVWFWFIIWAECGVCLLYTSDAADDWLVV